DLWFRLLFRPLDAPAGVARRSGNPPRAFRCGPCPPAVGCGRLPALAGGSGFVHLSVLRRISVDSLERPVLVTGGAGYIGSHTVVELLRDGRRAVIVDDFSNSHPGVLAAVAELGGAEPVLEEGDIRDRGFLDDVIARHRPQSAIHFAAKKAVGESVEIPATYLDINIGGTATLVAALHDAG